MKPRIGALLVVLVCASQSSSASAGITDVHIFPAEPTVSDAISIITGGIESQGPVEVGSTEFSVEDYSLQLDLYLNVGFLHMVTSWSYPYDIGPLSVGQYDLTVRTFEMSEITDIFSTEFEVVPEPMALLVLALGGLTIIRKRPRPQRYQGAYS